MAELCASDIEKAKKKVPKEGEVFSEMLLYAAESAFAIRSGGKAFSVRKRKEKKPKGTEWDEDQVESLYPKLTKYYQKWK